MRQSLAINPKLIDYRGTREMHVSEDHRVDEVQLVATDLDGTLLRNDGTISLRTQKVLKRLRAAGVVVVLVTARPPRIVRIIAKNIGATGLVICCNGAITYDLTTDAIIVHVPIPPEVACRIVSAVRLSTPRSCFAVERGLRFGCEPAYAAINPIPEQHEPFLDDALALCTIEVTKLIVRHPDIPVEDLLHRTRSIAGDTVFVTYSSASFVEVSAAGISKASALEALCDRLRIVSSQVIAFGDMPNDLPMLRWAGHGVAVANAHVDVLAAADEVTLSNNEDGVAVMLERLLVPGRNYLGLP